MSNSNLRFTLLALVATPVFACSIHSNDSGPGQDTLPGDASTLAGSGGASTASDSSASTSSVVASPSGSSTTGPIGVTGAGGTENAIPLGSSSSGTAGGAGGAPSSEPPAESSAGAAGATPQPDDEVDPPFTSTPVLMITEYVEGSSYNKAVEITNLDQNPFTASDCSLEIYFNGGTDPTTVPLDSEIEAGASWVVCHGRGSKPLIDSCDVTTSSLSFNGDDALVVQCNGVVLDSFGQIGLLPDGGFWGTGELSSQDHTLRRLCPSAPRLDPKGAFEPETYFASAGSESDIFDDLGSYVCE